MENEPWFIRGPKAHQSTALEDKELQQLLEKQLSIKCSIEKNPEEEKLCWKKLKRTVAHADGQEIKATQVIPQNGQILKLSLGEWSRGEVCYSNEETTWFKSTISDENNWLEAEDIEEFQYLLRRLTRKQSIKEITLWFPETEKGRRGLYYLIESGLTWPQKLNLEFESAAGKEHIIKEWHRPFPKGKWAAGPVEVALTLPENQLLIRCSKNGTEYQAKELTKEQQTFEVTHLRVISNNATDACWEAFLEAEIEKGNKKIEISAVIPNPTGNWLLIQQNMPIPAWEDHWLELKNHQLQLLLRQNNIKQITINTNNIKKVAAIMETIYNHDEKLVKGCSTRWGLDHKGTNQTESSSKRFQRKIGGEESLESQNASNKEQTATQKKQARKAEKIQGNPQDLLYQVKIDTSQVVAITLRLGSEEEAKTAALTLMRHYQIKTAGINKTNLTLIFPAGMIKEPAAATAIAAQACSLLSQKRMLSALPEAQLRIAPVSRAIKWSEIGELYTCESYTATQKKGTTGIPGKRWRLTPAEKIAP